MFAYDLVVLIESTKDDIQKQIFHLDKIVREEDGKRLSAEKEKTMADWWNGSLWL